ncbi:DUF2075 domain-containing protein [Pseudogemmatithrix spongiicola]|uniref:DUF2075 domain-containing protein n=1 Tax=Pseudogemmatithrix spongiicola TaxID=3062599 RepID=A0AA49Q6M5_9BACT|nr:DUF2075 domain-containing protein [Gemmatimonadaceae bacterium 'strain 138']WKW13829.1 DUF2075 domain-containing protein [Gemmatimonadaceae bacterium 'strain 318']
MSEREAGHGWGSDFPEFRSTPARSIRERLERFLGVASPEQIRAWDDSIPPLQREVDKALLRDTLAATYSTILEYELPMESRRPDVILLVGAAVVVLELKGKSEPTIADLDQVSAYARDLRCYHRECESRSVIPVLVPTRARGYAGSIEGVHVAGPDALDDLVSRFVRDIAGDPVPRDRFLAESAYRPLPTLVEAARELMSSGTLRSIHRAKAATDPCVNEISSIIHTAALTKSRHLVLVTGVPGAGKTLVGLRTVHAHFLDDLAVARGREKPSAPAVFLSGNGPLVEVLQYELKQAGGDGKTFVRGVKDYVKKYSRNRESRPPEHVLVFDEAQRAFDAAKMADSHDGAVTGSEPEQFIEFAERIPDWCVVVALIGSGQEINTGEEGGVGQWRLALEKSSRGAEWTIHSPPALADEMRSHSVTSEFKYALNLDRELRFHAATDLHKLVADVLSDAEPSDELGRRLEADGYRLRITRELETAKRYLRERYSDDPQARYGLLASARDKSLSNFGIPNEFQATKALKHGPWYGDAEDAPGGRSCRRLESCVTEFGAQGLELDASLLAWGTDLLFERGRWSDRRARGYKRGALVHDPLRLRINAYRVLMTRGRDALVLWIPPLSELDQTWQRLSASGFRGL